MCTFITNILFVVQNGGSKKVNVQRLYKIHTILALRIYYRTFHSDVTRRVTWSSAATGWQKREVGGHLPCVYALQ